jgi:hypothetical protein
VKSSSPRRFGAVAVFSLLVLCSRLSPATLAAAADGGAAAQGGATPTHGSRATASDGTMVVYDNVIGSYRVPGQQNTYWFGDRFYLYENGVWLSSAKAAGPFELTSGVLVPVALRQCYTPPKKAVTAKLPSGTEAVFAPDLKVYKVAGKRGVFLFDGRFFRYDNGLWLGSQSDDGPWTASTVKGLPLPLRRAVGTPEDKTSVVLPSGETVIYDGAAGVFRLEGKPDTYLFDGTFYDKRGPKWFAAGKAAGDYQEVVASKVPQPLRTVYRKAGMVAEGKAGKDGAAKKHPPKTPEERAAARKQREAKANGAGAKADKPAHEKGDKADKPAGQKGQKAGQQARQKKNAGDEEGAPTGDKPGKNAAKHKKGAEDTTPTTEEDEGR